MTEDLTLNMNAYLPLRDVVFNTLREAILKGELKPGERLMELQLAAKLGVSRTPIREAIRMLEQEGLAVTIPRKGAEVARMTESFGSLPYGNGAPAGVITTPAFFALSTTLFAHPSSVS